MFNSFNGLVVEDAPLVGTPSAKRRESKCGKNRALSGRIDRSRVDGVELTNRPLDFTNEDRGETKRDLIVQIEREAID